MDTLDIPEYAVDCHTRRSPGVTYGDARHVKSRIASNLRYYNRYSRIKIYKRQGNKYVQFLDNAAIEQIVQSNINDLESIKMEVHRIIDNA